jgi:hypothetical protein
VIRIAFSRNSSLLSRLIRWVSKGRVSHSLARLTLGGIPFVVESVLMGVRMVTWTRWQKAAPLYAEYQLLRPEPSQEQLQAALDDLGDFYDYVGLLGYIPVLLWRWMGRKRRNPLASASSQVCSEFVVRFLQHLYPLDDVFQLIDPETVTPEDLLKLCEETTTTFKALPSPAGLLPLPPT